MSKVTAEEARKLAGYDEYPKMMEKIYKRIREAAESGQVTVRIGDSNYGPTSLGTCQATRANGKLVLGTALGNRVAEELYQGGFALDTYYEERQFVDLGLVISWGTQRATRLTDATH